MGITWLSKRKTTGWTNPSASVGKLIVQLDKNRKCWQAIGLARELFNRTLGTEIGNHLNRCCDGTLQSVVWTIYMIGSKPDTAVPHIIFISRDEASRKSVEKQIKRSGILGYYPGIETGNMAMPPEFGSRRV